MATEQTVTEQAPPPTEQKPPAKPPVDPELKQWLIDIGKLVEEDKKPSDALPSTLPGITLGEAVKNSEEKRKIQEETDKDKPVEPEKPAEEKPKEAPKEEKPAETPAPKVEVKKKEDVERELQAVIDKRIAEAMPKAPVAPPAPPAAAAPTAPEDDYEAKLGEIEQEELRFARYAAQKDPNLKDYPKQLIEYLKKAEAYAEKARKDDPERTIDDEDQEWRKWQRENRPKVSPVVRKKLEREQMVEEAEAKADAKWRAELARVEKRQELLEKRPVIEKITQEFSKGLDEILEAAPEGEDSPVAPIVKRAKEVGWGKAVEEDPLFAPIVQRVQFTANNLANEFLGIVNGTIAFDGSNENHKWIAGFVQKQGDDFAANGGDARMRNGQTFLPRYKYTEVATADPARAAQFWTWSDGEILQRMAANAKKNALNAINIEKDKLLKAGYARKTVEPSKKEIPNKENKPTEEPKPTGSPKAPSSSSPGIAQPTKVAAQIGAFAPEEIDSIIPGYKKP